MPLSTFALQDLSETARARARPNADGGGCLRACECPAAQRRLSGTLADASLQRPFGSGFDAF
jgi:hypothetical protein